jgi:hypothetical protein
VGSGTYWSRRLARQMANPAGAIYGTIVVTGFTAAAGAHGGPLGRIAATATVTLLVFWLAHVYSEVVANRFHGAGFRFSVVRATMADELPMIEAPALSLVFLFLGVLGVLSDQVAIVLALVNGVTQLLVWGVVVARRQGWSWPGSLGSGLVDASFGAAIIILEALLH